VQKNVTQFACLRLKKIYKFIHCISMPSPSANIFLRANADIKYYLRHGANVEFFGNQPKRLRYEIVNVEKSNVRVVYSVS
jgi:hypothetical protein